MAEALSLEKALKIIETARQTRIDLMTILLNAYTSVERRDYWLQMALEYLEHGSEMFRAVHGHPQVDTAATGAPG